MRFGQIEKTHFSATVRCILSDKILIYIFGSNQMKARNETENCFITGKGRNLLKKLDVLKKLTPNTEDANLFLKKRLFSCI